MNKNVIVTGATGFVGRYLVAELLQNGYGVYAVVRNPEKLPKYDNDAQLHIIHIDLEQLTAADFGNTQFDCFFHLGWAGVNRDEIDDEAVHKLNKELNMKRTNENDVELTGTSTTSVKFLLIPHITLFIKL